MKVVIGVLSPRPMPCRRCAIVPSGCSIAACCAPGKPLTSPFQPGPRTMTSRQFCGVPDEGAFEEPAAAAQARSRRLAADGQTLQRQLEARDAAIAEMQNRVREQEGVMATQAALIQQMEDDILRSAE